MAVGRWGTRGRGRVWTDVPSDADGEGPVLPVAAFYEGHLAPEEASRSIEYFVCVAVVWGGMRV
jgi:hypothetical protein